MLVGDMPEKFQGIYSILPTPFQEDGSLDLKGLEGLLEHNLKAGVNGIVILGSNGEFPYLSLEEKKIIIRVTARVVAKRVPLIVGGSSFFTREAQELAEIAQAAGADGLLTALPIYYPIRFEDLLAHYRGICEKIAIPVFYYNFPEASGGYLKVKEFIEVLKLPGVAGAKNSQVNIGYFKELLGQSRSLNKAVFTGAEFNLKKVLEMGGAGAMGPLVNIWPEKALEIYRLTREGRGSEAALAQRDIFCLMPIMGGPLLWEAIGQAAFNLVSRPLFSRFYQPRPTIALLKEALRQMGLPITARVRSPLPQLTKADREKVEKTLARMNSLKSKLR